MSPPSPDRSTPGSRFLWTLRLAWRESRRHPLRFLVAGLPVVLGIASLVAVESFRHNLEVTVEQQSRQLLGADLLLATRQAPDEALESFLEEVPGERSREVQFSSMLSIPESGEARLVQVRALDGPFPWYGEIQTDPPDALQEQQKNPRQAILEESLRVQFSLDPEQEIRLGDLPLTVGGTLRQAPGEAGALGLIAPRVYLNMATVEESGLLTTGSVARYRFFFLFPPDLDPDQWVEDNRSRLDELRLEPETVAQRREALADAFQLLSGFLHLVGFTALLLGAIGVGSAIRVWAESKRDQIAILRCLGCRHRNAWQTVFWQVLASGLGGALSGGIAGVGLQYLLPAILGDFLPFQVEVFLSPPAILGGILFGFCFTLLFALPPLLGLGRISPFHALRSDFSPSGKYLFWRQQWPYPSALLLVFLFAFWQIGEIAPALYYTGGLLVAISLLWLGALALLRTLRRLIPHGAPWVVRQSTANLFRPRNQTTLVLVAIGLSTAFLLTLFLVRQNALAQIAQGTDDEQANLAFFDIQPDQKDDFLDLIESAGLPRQEAAPIVTMRLQSLAGEPVEEWLRRGEVPRWTLQREYRSTYQGNLREGERLHSGEWIGEVSRDKDIIPVSLELGLARDWGLDLGDRAVFDVQGVPLEVEIASLREVDWREMRPNFFFIFPEGVLEAAPRFYVTVTRAPTTEASANLQREVVRNFPNVSILDLSMVLETIASILQRVGFVIQFMSLFTVSTGLVLLFSVIGTERRQRMQEIYLLRIQGASRGNIRGILYGEYLLLGSLAAFIGTALGTLWSWLLTRWVLDLPWNFYPGTLLLTAFLVIGITILAGLLAGTRDLHKSPLAALREE